MIGKPFNKQTPESFYQYVKDLRKEKTKKEAKNGNTDKPVRKKRAKKNAEAGEASGPALLGGNELQLTSNNPGMPEESGVQAT